MKKRIKAHIRKKCRKCGTLLVNKPEYGAVCPKCGWCRGWYTVIDESDCIGNIKPLVLEMEGSEEDAEKL